MKILFERDEKSLKLNCLYSQLNLIWPCPTKMYLILVQINSTDIFDKMHKDCILGSEMFIHTSP